MKKPKVYWPFVLLSLACLARIGAARFDPQAGGTQGRSYTAGRYALELDGVISGWVSSAEGGHVEADVVNQKLGADNLVHKHIGNVKYEDIALTCGTGMSKGMYDWMKAELAGNYKRHNGAIISCDFNGNVKSRLEFQNALISEVGFPALDAASKDAAKMTLKFSPELTRMQTGQGAKVSTPVDQNQKKWLPANFKLTIDGTDCTRVNKIEAITIKQKVVETGTGATRDFEKQPGSAQGLNLVITLPESNAKSFYDWHESFVINGHSANGTKSGQLTFLTPDLRTELFTLTFHNLGISKVSPDKVEAGGEPVKRVKVEMYCEKIDFMYGSAAWASRRARPVAGG